MNIFSKERWDWLLSRKAERRMQRRAILPALLVFPTLIASLNYAQTNEHLGIRALIAASPLIPLLWTIVLHWQSLKEFDEFERIVEFKALAFAGALSLVMCMVCLLLTSANALPKNIDYRVILSASLLVTILGYVVVRTFLYWKHS
jgi:hypothetical protein